MRDGGGEHDRRVTDHVLSVYLLTPLSLPAPPPRPQYLLRRAERGRRLMTFFWETEGLLWAWSY